LRTGVRNAEPEVVGLAPQTTRNDRKAHTMKTYILRDAKAVEPQNRKRQPLPDPLPADPAIAATVVVICGPATLPPAALGGRVLYVGLDVHNDTIAVSLAPSDSPEVRRYGIIGGQHEDVLKLLKKLQTTPPGAVLKFCYEAGPRGSSAYVVAFVYHAFAMRAGRTSGRCRIYWGTRM
jgi:hypothetical protein